MNTSRIVRFEKFGGPEVLNIEELPVEAPKAGEVLLKVQAIGLNRADALFRSGSYLEQPKFPSRIGVEAAGIVDALGSGVTNVRLGGRVSVAPGQSIGRYGTYGETAIVPAASVIPYPENLTPPEAASVWVQYLTPCFAFVDMAAIQPGQTILITAASGGTGLGSIQMARLLGATVIATTRSAEKEKALRDAGAHHVVVGGNGNLAIRVMEITGGRGADVVFDPVAGGSLPALADSVAWGGQIILYGALDAADTRYPLLTAFARNFSLRTYLLYNYCGLPDLGLHRNEEAFQRAIQFIQRNLAEDKFKPIIAKTFPLSQVREAHQYMESNQQLGKIVLTV
jgi:NADPH2:quinone reductase